MVYDVCLDVASLLIMIIIMFGSGRQYTEYTEQHRRFRVSCMVTMIALFSDIMGAFFISYSGLLPVKVNMVVQSFGFAMIALTVFLYAGYMESFIPKDKRSKKFHVINAVILTMYYLFHITNVGSGLIFYFDEQGIYTRGVLYLAVYVIPFYFFLYGVVIMVRNHKYVERRQYLATMSLVLFISVGTFLQFSILSNYLVILFAVTLAEMVIFFNLETPDYQKLTETMKQLEISQREAEEANKAKSNFLAQMSHEIRTPINAVLGMNEMILRESKEEAVLGYASNAYNAGKALLSTINDILDISKIEAGKLEIVETEYDLYSLVSDCYHLTAERAAKKHLRFLYSVEESLPSKLFGDMFHLRQIVVNFLTNAIKYTDNGSVTLTFSGKRTEGDFVLCVSVEDTGIGLTQESLNNLFTSFQRFDLERNQSVEGTGLGLSICKQMSELMGGTVDVESTYGKGSVFRCTIPQRIVDDRPIGKITLEQPVTPGNIDSGKLFTAPEARILVVDDVDMNLIVFRSLLKGHRLQIDEAMSGSQCLEMVQKKKYDIIFMDHMMPEMDGVETFTRMGQMEHMNTDTPVIMLTANAISGDKEKYLASGFASYLSKPIQSEQLENMLLSYLPQEKIVWGGKTDQKTENVSAGGKKLQEEPAEDSESLLYDVKLGLSYVGGDEDGYYAILSSYVNAGQTKLSRIQMLFEQELWKDYVTEVHALKSTSLSIGSRILSKKAAELEQAGKAGEYDVIRGKNENLLSCYEQVLDITARELHRMEEERKPEFGAGTSKSVYGEPGELEEITKERLKESIERICVAADDFDSDEIIAQYKKLCDYEYQGTPLAAGLQKIKEAAEDFEYEQAKDAAEQFWNGFAGL